MNTAKLSRRQFLAGSLAGCAALQTWTHATAARARNILFIMTDQHNAHALGCYGSREVKTPNMDRLARQGALFEQAFCQTGQCCPSRYSIWTGRYARTHGLYYNGQLENRKEDTVADILRRKGYMSCRTSTALMLSSTFPNIARSWNPKEKRGKIARAISCPKMYIRAVRASVRAGWIMIIIKPVIGLPEPSTSCAKVKTSHFACGCRFTAPTRR